MKHAMKASLAAGAVLASAGPAVQAATQAIADPKDVLLARASEDPAFAARLLSDPHAAARDLGVELPAGLLRAIEEAAHSLREGTGMVATVQVQAIYITAQPPSAPNKKELRTEPPPKKA